MKNSEAVTDANTVITIPRQFQKALFKPFKGKDFILNIFDGNVADAETFMAILDDKAANLSDDFDGAEWVLTYSHHFRQAQVGDSKSKRS